MTNSIIKRSIRIIAYIYVYAVAFIMAFLYVFILIGATHKDLFLLIISFIVLYIPYVAINHLCIRYMIPHKLLINLELTLLLTVLVLTVTYIIWHVPSIAHIRQLQNVSLNETMI